MVIRGAGPMFSSGMDLGSLADLAGAPERLRAFRARCLEAWNLAEEMTKPTICQIHGACIGGAMELALACDLRVIAADALVGMPETRIGLIPDVGGSSRLPAVVGVGRAKELIMTGKLIGGEEAERIGLANRIAPADALDEATAGAGRRAARVRARRRWAGEAGHRRLGPSGAVDDAGARGCDAGAVRGDRRLRGGRGGVPGEAAASVRGSVVRSERQLRWVGRFGGSAGAQGRYVYLGAVGGTAIHFSLRLEARVYLGAAAVVEIDETPP